MSQAPGPPPVPRSRSAVRKVIRWLSLSLLVLAGLALIWYVTGRARDYSAVRRLEAQVRKKGEPLTLKELAASYPPIPDEQNAAVPLLNLWENEDPLFWASFRQGIRPLPEKSVPSYDPQLPYLGKGEFKIGQKLSPESREAALSFLTQKAGHIEAVRSALKRPSFAVRSKLKMDSMRFCLTYPLSKPKRRRSRSPPL